MIEPMTCTVNWLCCVNNVS